MSSAAPTRDQNLDLLRAVAVLSVVLYHLLQWSPLDPLWLDRLARYGAYGVDLFFILSGFLIGSIYWREERDTGRVQLMRFLKRRWLRTIPPYIGALLLAWGAVWYARGEAFDWRYLFFLQNYGSELPFFLVSWSLCVEEHFYLVVPLLMGLTRTFKPVRPFLLAIGVIAPLLLRAHDASIGSVAPFGFYHTATHLHFEGLTLGLALAWLNAYRPDLWTMARRAARWLVIPLLALCWIGTSGSREINYVLMPSLVASLFGALLLAVAGRRPIAGRAFAAPVRTVAITSYSVYLVHPLMIHIGNIVNQRIGFIGDGLTLFVVWPLLIVGFGYAFYYVVERGSLALRDLWAPSVFAGGGLEHPLARANEVNADHPIAEEIGHAARINPSATIV
ncbi:acyltransferase family protein [Sphingomonas alpina]|uniref:Acyltransferase n=1 Tax=Sphingomonas alpina TaxID=653931 RepID=A0A7H0LDE4_9SPHN|nr:acyltransferase [Sphingomonas alpina]QNQ07697.1 acyltransferase [Sphingomonas alpina]